MTGAPATPGSHDPRPDARPRIGLVWDTPFKPGARHVPRFLQRFESFAPVVLTGSRVTPTGPFPAPIVPLDRRPTSLRKLYRKYVLRAPRCVYRGEAEGLVETVDEFDLRLVHVYFGHVAVARLACLRLLDVPFTVSFHGVDVAWCARDPALARHLPELFERAACVMTRSAFMSRSLVELGCPEAKLWENRTGIPLDEFPLRDRRRPASSPPIVLQVGRLVEKKGIRDTLEAFRILRETLPGARLRIAGDGPLRADLERRASALGLDGAVRFLGFLDQDALVDQLHGADLFVHPSRTSASGDREGIPNSLLEAMATGLAPIATRHAGIPEVIRDGVNGWLVPESSPEDLAERMLWCARNPDAVATAGVAARRFVETRHALSARARSLEARFAEVIRRSPARTGTGRPIRDRLREIDLPRYRV